MKKKNPIYSFIALLDIYKNNELGLNISADDCRILSEEFNKICIKYNINEYEEDL